MACAKYEEKINQLIDGELSEKEEARVKKHMEECPPCKGYYNTLLLMHDAFEEIGEEEAPEGLAESVMELVKAERRPKREFSFRFPFTAAAAVIVVVLYALNGHLFNISKSADIAAKEKAADSAAAESSRGYGAEKSAKTQTSDVAEQPTLSLNESQNSVNYSIAPDTAQANGLEEKNSTEATSREAGAESVPAPETENKQGAAPPVDSGNATWTAPQTTTKYVITGVGGGAALKTAVDTAPIQKLGKVGFAYYVMPKESLREKLGAYTPFAQVGAYSYYKLTAEEWNSVSAEAENTSAIEGVTTDETADYGVIVIPTK